MTEPLGFLEVDLFPEDVDSAEHPEALAFKALLEQVAEDYRCRLLVFEVDRGTVTFSFDSELLMAEILKILQER